MLRIVILCQGEELKHFHKAHSEVHDEMQDINSLQIMLFAPRNCLVIAEHFIIKTGTRTHIIILD